MKTKDDTTKTMLESEVMVQAWGYPDSSIASVYLTKCYDLERQRDEHMQLILQLRDALSKINYEAGKQWQATEPLPCIESIEKWATHALDKCEEVLGEA